MECHRRDVVGIAALPPAVDPAGRDRPAPGRGTRAAAPGLEDRDGDDRSGRDLHASQTIFVQAALIGRGRARSRRVAGSAATLRAA